MICLMKDEATMLFWFFKTYGIHMDIDNIFIMLN